MLDLILRGGTVVDGTGGVPFTADVGVSCGRIAAIERSGRLGEAARRTIEADGLLVTPGFVDVHAHYDGQATWDRRLAPSSWHGVTTVVMGNCGVGFAPVRARDRETLIQLMEGVEDIPGAALHEGISWEWESFADYLGALERVPRDIDVCALVPHGAVRLYVMGARGADRAPATEEEIREMGRLVREAVAAGAFGFSTSRTLNHRTSTGAPTPTLGAAAAELHGIVAEMRRAGRGAFEVVSDFEDVAAEFATFRAIAADTGARTFVSLNQNKRGGYRTVLDLVARAASDGVPMTAQVAVRGIGVLLGVEGTVSPFVLNPEWCRVPASAAARVAALSEPAFRQRLAEAAEEPRHRFGSYDRYYPVGDEPDYEPPPERSIAALAAASGRHPVDVLCDLLLADGGRGLVYYPIFNYEDGNLEAQRELLEHPATIVGLADGGAHVGTICDASFPTTMLTHWVRDRRRGPRFDLAWAVKAMTADTAGAYGLTDRGRLAPGLRADVNLIDLANLRVGRPEMVADLPAGGRRFVQRPRGYVATLVNGVVTYESGEPTGELSGRLVRSA
ncbi:MAG: amidohydrolase family protein [Deltaproteobacteria bacterium]|nr:amidohydrolase family protein [Deltaproteobacteria bacterium]